MALASAVALGERRSTLARPGLVLSARKVEGLCSRADSELRETEPAGELSIDVDWTETETMVLVPADHLSPAQKSSVMREFAMRDGRLVVDIPRAMKIYAVRQWGLDRPNLRLRIISTKDHITARQPLG